ncbi:MAG TPA: zeta toxin family protein [Gammaproteobacteria bacterium]|jgi:predicted ABC-type ATPase|nr:zeta toxin family protein [Gammaproteobacteria bacterium]
MPHVIIIAGSNGSGKSTAAPVLLQDAVHIKDFVNADVIAQGLSAFQPEKAAIQAGRIMLDRIKTLAKEKTNFAFETTLASRTFAGWIETLKEQGYHFHLVFLWLKNAELAISRVADRVKIGGHSVPETTIRRRYISGLKNFFNLYCPIANSWQLYDNSNNKLTLMASNIQATVNIENKEIWKVLAETYSE